MNKIIAAPYRRRMYLVFDVETTGLLPKQKRGQESGPTISEYPHILQLSFVLYDLEKRTIQQRYDSYVKVPDSVVIDPYITTLTGIDRAMCNRRGKPITTVLNDFFAAYKLCEGLVAHNLEFDTKMVLVEVERNQGALIERGLAECLLMFQPMNEKVRNIDRYCTMRKSINLCNILVANDRGETRRKFPKLVELHKHLFGGDAPENLHNAMVDVEACLRCYLKMRHNIE
jgi:DNA polymerase III epsilon subunit-like protein